MTTPARPEAQKDALTVGSLFAGIGGFDLGFERAGFSVRWQVEQDGKAQSVLSHRFASAKLYDDVRTVGASNLEPVDVICGGFPCQDVSVAGKREGLSGERTGLFSEVVRIARELSPRWVVLENVPGLLSSHRGRDFHAVLVALAECGFRRAYRILDSRYFGVAQRRRRVFLVLRARRCGDGPAAVLFEQPRGGGDSAAGDEAGTDVAATLRGRSHGAGVNAPGRGGEDDQNLVTGPLGGGNDGIGRRSEDDPNFVYPISSDCASGRSGTADSLSADANGIYRLRPPSLGVGHVGAPSFSITAGAVHAVATMGTIQSGPHGYAPEPGEGIIVASTLTQEWDRGPRGDGSDNLVANTLRASDGGPDEKGNYNAGQMGVRRLTPLECERLQGFPDGWTCLCGAGWQGSRFCECADSPRYRQLGNAVTVNVAHWIAPRIADFEVNL